MLQLLGSCLIWSKIFLKKILKTAVDVGLPIRAIRPALESRINSGSTFYLFSLSKMSADQILFLFGGTLGYKNIRMHPQYWGVDILEKYNGSK